VSRQPGKWAKTLLLILLIIFLILIITIIGTTLYLNKILTQEKVNKLAQKYSNLYLNRNLSFKSYRFDVFKGIILKDIHIDKNSELEYTTEIFIQEINLRYDFKQLLKLRLYIDKIIINNIKLNLDENIINKELAFYRDKFKSKTTNIIEEDKKKRSFNISLVNIIDSQIKYQYKGQPVILNINDIEFDSSFMKKLKSDVIVIYHGKKISINGEAYLYKGSGVIDYNISLPKKNKTLSISLETTNFIDFKLNSRLKYYGNNINLISTIVRSSNLITARETLIKDYKNQLYLPKTVINLKTQKINTSISGKLNKIDNTYLRNMRIKPPEGLHFLANLHINLKLFISLKYPEYPVISGTMYLKNSQLNVGKENFYFIKCPFVIKKNNLYANKAEMNYKDHHIKFSITKINILNPLSLYHIKLQSKVFNVNKFINLKSPLKYNFSSLKADGNLNLKQNQIDFKTVSLYFFKSRISVKGFLNYKYDNKILLQLNQEAKNINLKKMLDNLNIEQNLTGKLGTKLFIKAFIVKKKFELINLNGSLNSLFTYKDYENLDSYVSINLKNNRINMTRSYVIYDRNKIGFHGSYDLKKKYLDLQGSDNDLFLPSLQMLKQKYKGKINYNFTLKKKMTRVHDLRIKVNYKSPEVVFDNLKFKKIKGKLTINSNTISGNVNVNSFYQGSIFSEFTKDADNNLIIQAQGKDIKINPLMKDWVHENVSGTLKWELYLASNDKSRKGTFTASVREGEMETSYQEKINALMNELAPDITHIFTKDVTIDTKILNDIITFKKFFIKGPNIECHINGQYNIKSKSNGMIINMKLDESFFMHIPNFMELLKKYKKIIKKKEGKWYYINTIQFNEKNEPVWK